MAVSKVLSEALSFVPQGYLFGLTMSTAGSSTTLSVAAGSACDSTGLRIMKLVSSIAKTTSAWAVGTAAGGIDTGAIAASTWYHFFLIQRVDTGVVDVLFSLSATAPTLPANYTLFRRIGSMKTNGSSQWIAFKQFNDIFYWGTSVQDATLITINTDTLFTLSVPTGVRVEPFFHVGFSSSTTSACVRWRTPDLQSTETGITPTSGTASFASLANGTTSPATRITGGHEVVLTNTSAQINVITSNDTLVGFEIQTYGWSDDRGKLS